jgi:hypothetical protein
MAGVFQCGSVETGVLFASDLGHFRGCIVAFGAFCSLAGLAAGTGAGSAAAARCGLRLGFFLNHNLGRCAFDDRLRAGTIDDRCGNLGGLGHLSCKRSLLLYGTLAAFRAIRTTLAALIAVTAVFARRLILLNSLTLSALALSSLALTTLAPLALTLSGIALNILLTALLLRLRLVIFHHRLRCITQIITIDTVHVVLIHRIAVAILMLETVLHLGLRRCDDPVIMFCVLQIVLGDDTVAGALCIAGKSGIFFCDMLGSTADFYVRSGAVVGSAERVAALALEVVVTTTTAATAAVIVATTPSTTLILLSWPHLSFTNSLSSLIRGHAARRTWPVRDFACYAQVNQGGLPLSKSNYLIHASGRSTLSVLRKEHV